MEEKPIINNESKFEKVLKNMEESIQSLILFRSLYLIKKKFDVYKSNINKIYEDFNINKSKRIDVLGSYQIDINFLDKVLLLILKETNLFILKLSSPKDIFLSYFLISDQKLEVMELIINNMKKEIIEKNLVQKYNNIFYEKKIKPLFDKKPLPNNNNDLVQEGNGEENEKEEEIFNISIVEYNRKGKIIKSFDELKIENEKNKIEMNNKNSDVIDMIQNDNEQNENSNSDNNILYVETLPLILADYFEEHKIYAVVEIEEEFSKELDLLFNKDLLIKINEYDEFIQKYKNYNNNANIITKELKQYSLQLKQIQKNIKLYEQIIVNKKMKNENTIFLEDMLNKLIEKETYVQQKINEKKQSIGLLSSDNPNENNIFDKIKKFNNINNLDFSGTKKENLNNSLKTNIKVLSIKNPKLFENKINNNKNDAPSVFITSQNNNTNQNIKNFMLNNTSKKILLKSELTEEKIKNALNEIFLFYSALISENDNMEGNNINNKFIDINNYLKFCIDYRIYLTKPKIKEIFMKFSKGINDNNNILLIMNFENFKSSLMELSYLMNSMKKQKLLKIISEKKNIINYMELKECQRQEEEKNHNRFTEKITGGIPKKSLEKSQFDYISNHKKISDDIFKYESIYGKECKKSEKEKLECFYKYLGIHSGNYKNKMKDIKKNIFYQDLLKSYKNNNEASQEIKFNNQQSRIQTKSEIKNNINYNLYSEKKSKNIDYFNNSQLTKSNIMNNLKSNKNENNILKLSTISKDTVNKINLFENYNKMNWNQMKNIHFDYNPIYDNNGKKEPEIGEENIKIINKSINKNKLVKNYSALELKGINKKYILPPIKNNNINNENNLRYYDMNNISNQKENELTNSNNVINVFNSEDN